MNLTLLTRLLCCCTLLCFFSGGYAQIATEQLQAYDAKTGLENLPIYNGKVHINKDVTLQQDNRYLFDNFKNSTVFYKGQPYANVACKYDLLEDALIILPYNSSSSIAIKGITSKIDSFYIEETKQFFINLKKKKIASAGDGFYEKIIGTPRISGFIKHSKKVHKRIEAGVNYDIFKQQADYFIMYSDTLYQVNGKRDVMKLFPAKEEMIQNFYKEEKALYKRSDKEFLQKLIGKLASSSSYSN